ncbi:hypothetical protein [Microbacterium sp.]|uniref:hypothetical protein n=1 Tax=Microbacterium sp. TaxID=51671 RepID=UPI0028122CC1|nr:hypothetical protein [Microbacterium sp.]
MTMEHYRNFIDEAADLVRQAITTVLPDADVTTTETAVVLTSALALDRLGCSERDFDTHLASRGTDRENRSQSNG